MNLQVSTTDLLVCLDLFVKISIFPDSDYSSMSHSMCLFRMSQNKNKTKANKEGIEDRPTNRHIIIIYIVGQSSVPSLLIFPSETLKYPKGHMTIPKPHCQNSNNSYVTQSSEIAFPTVNHTYLTSWGLLAITLFTKLALTDTSCALSWWT